MNYIFSLIFLSMILVVRLENEGNQESILCANEDCTEPLSIAETVNQYFGGGDNFLNLHKGQKVKILGKSIENKGPWFIEVSGGKRGFAPYSHLKEKNVLPNKEKLRPVPKSIVEIKTAEKGKKQEYNSIKPTPSVEVIEGTTLYPNSGYTDNEENKIDDELKVTETTSEPKTDDINQESSSSFHTSDHKQDGLNGEINKHNQQTVPISETEETKEHAEEQRTSSEDLVNDTSGKIVSNSPVTREKIVNQMEKSDVPNQNEQQQNNDSDTKTNVEHVTERTQSSDKGFVDSSELPEHSHNPQSVQIERLAYDSITPISKKDGENQIESSQDFIGPNLPRQVSEANHNVQEHQDSEHSHDAGTNTSESSPEDHAQLPTASDSQTNTTIDSASQNIHDHQNESLGSSIYDVSNSTQKKDVEDQTQQPTNVNDRSSEIGHENPSQNSVLNMTSETRSENIFEKGSSDPTSESESENSLQKSSSSLSESKSENFSQNSPPNLISESESENSTQNSPSNLTSKIGSENSSQKNSSSLTSESESENSPQNSLSNPLEIGIKDSQNPNDQRINDQTQTTFTDSGSKNNAQNIVGSIEQTNNKHLLREKDHTIESESKKPTDIEMSIPGFSLEPVHVNTDIAREKHEIENQESHPIPNGPSHNLSKENVDTSTSQDIVKPTTDENKPSGNFKEPKPESEESPNVEKTQIENEKDNFSGDIPTESSSNSKKEVVEDLLRKSYMEDPEGTVNDISIEDKKERIEHSLPVDQGEVNKRTQIYEERKDGWVNWFSSVTSVMTSFKELFANSNLEGSLEDEKSNADHTSNDDPSLSYYEKKIDGTLVTTGENDNNGYCEKEESCNNQMESEDLTDKRENVEINSDESPLLEPGFFKLSTETIVMLLVTSVVVLIFSLGHYYIEKSRRDGDFIGKINTLEGELFLLKKEHAMIDDQLTKANENATVVESKIEEREEVISNLQVQLEEMKISHTSLEDIISRQEKEIETLMENGMEMHKLLSESMSDEERTQMLLANIAELKESLTGSLNEIVSLGDQLNVKNQEIQILQLDLKSSSDKQLDLEQKLVNAHRGIEEQVLHCTEPLKQQIIKLEQAIEEKTFQLTQLETEIAKQKSRCEILSVKCEVAEKGLQEAHGVKSSEALTEWLNVNEIKTNFLSAEKQIATLKEERERILTFKEEVEEKLKAATHQISQLNEKYELAEKDKMNALTKLQVLSNYFKEKEIELQEQLGLKESQWLQKQSEDHTIYEQMRSLREENLSYKSQNDTLKKEILDQEASFKKQIANEAQKAHENWVSFRQADRRWKESQMEAAHLRNRVTAIESSASLINDEKMNPNGLEANGESPFPPAASPPFMLFPREFIPPPPLTHTTPTRPPPLGRISSPPLPVDFTPPPPLMPYEIFSSPSPPPPPLHKPQPRDAKREQKESLSSNYSSESTNDKPIRRSKR